MADQIELLKNRRLFARTIRDGIALMVELREGRVDLLLELFPWIADAFTPAAPPAPDLAAALTQLAATQTQLAQALQQRPAGQGSALSQPPPDDDAPLVVTKDADAGKRSAQNFIDSMFRLQQ